MKNRNIFKEISPRSPERNTELWGGFWSEARLSISEQGKRTPTIWRRFFSWQEFTSQEQRGCNLSHLASPQSVTHWEDKVHSYAHLKVTLEPQWHKPKLCYLHSLCPRSFDLTAGMARVCSLMTEPQLWRHGCWGLVGGTPWLGSHQPEEVPMVDTGFVGDLSRAVGWKKDKWPLDKMSLHELIWVPL